MINKTIVDDSVKKMVLDYFYNNNDNRTLTISKKLKIKRHIVDFIIDENLSSKKHYMGGCSNLRPKTENR
tara:strand:+ start:1358 stop:1567 length:210 start_codon:yes stop_codon:yes gene_type:complete